MKAVNKKEAEDKENNLSCEHTKDWIRKNDRIIYVIDQLTNN